MNSPHLPFTRAPQHSLFWRFIASTLRIGFLTAFSAGLLLAAGAYFLGRDIGLFDLNNSSLDVIVRQAPVDNTLVFDRNGEKLGEFFANYHVYTPYKAIPKNIINAIVAIEDREFFQHKGISPRGIARATWTWLRTGHASQGASTITQQVVRQFLLTRERTLFRKVQEAALALRLEQITPKERIFEIYANYFFLGNGAYGVGAAAKRYFNKPLNELTLSESALIAGLFQSPSRLDPTEHPEKARARQAQVLKAMESAHYLRHSDFTKALKTKMQYETYTSMNERIAPYFIDYVKKDAEEKLGQHKTAAGKKYKLDSGGLRIFTTLDLSLQKAGVEAIAQNSNLLHEAEAQTLARNWRKKGGSLRVEASLLSVDPRTGEILAMVGGRDFATSQFNRAADSLRQPGSAFKPIIFSLALGTKWKWSDLMFVAPVSFGSYRPRTSSEEYMTETTLLRAFYKSLNGPVVDLGSQLGLSNVITHAKNLGVRSPIKDEFGSLLGSSEVTMLDMARVYGTFANGGQRVDPIAITRIEDRNGRVIYRAPTPAERTAAVISPQVAYLMTQGMHNVLSMGTGFRAADMADIAAGKTGTSNDSADNWFCGYTTSTTTIAWVGTDERSGIYGAFTGGSLALPIWENYMHRANARRGAGPFPRPAGIVDARVHPLYGNVTDNGVRMYFLQGREPSAQTNTQGAGALSDAASRALEMINVKNARPSSLGSANTPYRDIFSQ